MDLGGTYYIANESVSSRSPLTAPSLSPSQLSREGRWSGGGEFFFVIRSRAGITTRRSRVTVNCHARYLTFDYPFTSGQTGGHFFDPGNTLVTGTSNTPHDQLAKRLCLTRKQAKKAGCVISQQFFEHALAGCRDSRVRCYYRGGQLRTGYRTGKNGRLPGRMGLFRPEREKTAITWIVQGILTPPEIAAEDIKDLGEILRDKWL